MKASWIGNSKEGIKGKYKETEGDFEIFSIKLKAQNKSVAIFSDN